ncbi:MAG: MAPEG family protein [Pseudomonadota bacterium]
MESTRILWPLAIHLALIGSLYAWLTFERKVAVSRGDAKMSDYRLFEGETERARLIANSISNQFELPTVFYPLGLYLMATDKVTPIYLGLAYLFVLARIPHALIHVLSPDVALRGNVFTVNFLALVAMWAVFLFENLFS